MSGIGKSMSQTVKPSPEVIKSIKYAIKNRDIRTTKKLLSKLESVDLDFNDNYLI